MIILQIYHQSQAFFECEFALRKDLALSDRNYAPRQGENILIAESLFMEVPISYAGTTWARKGETPVVRSTGARYRLNMLSAVNRRGRMRFMIEKKGLNADVVCQFLHRLMVGSTKPVFLIWDGHPIHKSGQVAETVRSYKGRLRVYLLPGYSPELNPAKVSGVR